MFSVCTQFFISKMEIIVAEERVEWVSEIVFVKS